MQFIVSNWENTYVKDTKLITQEELELQSLTFRTFKIHVSKENNILDMVRDDYIMRLRFLLVL